MIRQDLIDTVRLQEHNIYLLVWLWNVCVSEHQCYDTRKSNFFLRINFVEMRERNVLKFGIKIERTLSIFAVLDLFIDRQID